MNGAVRSYDARRGVGIIAPDRGADVAVHANELERAGFAQLESGERLNFDIKNDLAAGRRFAVNLSRLKDA